MFYNRLLLCGRGWIQWTIDETTRRRLAPTISGKTSLQTPTLRVCAWIIFITREKEKYGTRVR
jgi:hypothetical protein